MRRLALTLLSLVALTHVGVGCAAMARVPGAQAETDAEAFATGARAGAAAGGAIGGPQGAAIGSLLVGVFAVAARHYERRKLVARLRPDLAKPKA